MNEPDIVAKTAEFIKGKLSGEASGHDWWHIYRVWQTAKHIAEYEPGADKTIVELGALLHDIADWKFTGGDLEAGPKAAREWLEKNGIAEDTVSHIEDIIRDTSFKGANELLHLKTHEAKIVFDADKLDSLGAIGVARAFATGAKFDETFYDPNIPVPKYASAKEYVAAKGQQNRTVINHFYEKLLLLKGLMQTETGRQMARRRHEYMEQYLEQFYAEWEGRR